MNMKNLFGKTFFAACALVVAASFASCLGNDNDDDNQRTLTKSEKAKYCSAIMGVYDGFLYYQPDYSLDYNSSSLKTDSVSVHFTITAQSDTLAALNIPMFPASLLGEYKNIIADGTSRSILQNLPDQEFIALLVPFYYDASYYTFYLLPNFDGKALTNSFNTEQVYECSYNDADGSVHTVSISYTAYITTTTYYGTYGTLFYSPTTKGLVGSVLIKSVTVDGNTYTMNTIFNIGGK